MRPSDSQFGQLEKFAGNAPAANRVEQIGRAGGIGGFGGGAPAPKVYKTPGPAVQRVYPNPGPVVKSSGRPQAGSAMPPSSTNFGL